MSSPARTFNPLAWDYQRWRRFFAVAAAWNASGAVPSILFPGFNLRLFYGIETGHYITLFLNRGLWWAVLIFGIGYLIVAYDPGRHLGIVVMGIIGKVVIAVNWLYLFGLGQATGLVVFAALGDSAFTVFFLVYLFHGPRSDPGP